MAYEWISSPNFKAGRTSPIKYIVIHHWDDPAKKPTIQGVINHFKNPRIEVAAHYIVSGDRIIQMVKESDTAWQARSANPYTIGIEVDPQVPGNTYATVGRLVREIRSRHGHLPLRKHSDFVNTSCPGNLDINRIDREANTAPAPIQGDNNVILTEEAVKTLYRRLFKREGDPSGVKNYTGKTLDFALSDMSGSEEFKRTHTIEKIVEKPVEVIKEIIMEVPASANVDPAALEKAKRYDLIKEALK